MVLDAGVKQVQVALGNQLMVDPALTLADMPRFQHGADQSVSLVLDSDDLAALLGASDALGTAHDHGITDLRLDFVPDDAQQAELQSALQASGLHWSSAPLNSVEVALLGLGDELYDPNDPFALHTPKH